MGRVEPGFEEFAALAKRSTAALCGLIGHTVILYRKHPKKPRIAV